MSSDSSFHMTIKPRAALKKMRCRSPEEDFRVASPLELLFDLVFVVGLGTASAQFAHFVAEGGSDIISGLIGFAFCVFGLVWAWIYFTWFASAFDTDDWLYRLAMFAGMIGVVIFAIGIPDVFHSVTLEHLDNRGIVLGYVVMRLALVSQWLRVIRDDPEYRRTATGQVIVVVVAQMFWVAMAFADMPIVPALLGTAALAAFEFSGIMLVQRKFGVIRWHPHHLAERYGLLAIISLGEGVVGTVAAIAASVEHGGWSVESVLIVVVGITLTCAMWWTYFYTDNGELLTLHRERISIFILIHIVLYGAIAAVGAGLHIIGYHVEGESHLSTVGVLAAVAVPLGVYLLGLFAMLTFMVGKFAPSLWSGPVVALVLLIAGVAAGGAGLPIGWSLVIIGLAPILCAFVSDLAARRIAITVESGH